MTRRTIEGRILLLLIQCVCIIKAFIPICFGIAAHCMSASGVRSSFPSVDSSSVEDFAIKHPLRCCTFLSRYVRPEKYSLAKGAMPLLGSAFETTYRSPARSLRPWTLQRRHGYGAVHLNTLTGTHRPFYIRTTLNSTNGITPHFDSTSARTLLLRDLPCETRTQVSAAVEVLRHHQAEDLQCFVRSNQRRASVDRQEREDLLRRLSRGPLRDLHGRGVPLRSHEIPQNEVSASDPMKWQELQELILFATGQSTSQLDSIAAALIAVFRKELNIEVKGRDGNGFSGWVALNFGSLEIHVQTRITRKKYCLDRLYMQNGCIDLFEQCRP